jgi:hypothetical protein
MQYVNRVNQEVAQLGTSILYKEALPPHVREDVLLVKQLGADVAGHFGADISIEDERLLAHRVGGTMMRIATGSYIASQNGAPVEYFGELSESGQEDVAHKVMKRYKKIYTRARDWVDEVDPFDVIADNDSLPALSSTVMRTIVAQSKRAEMTGADRLRALVAYLNVLPGTFPPRGWLKTDYTLNDVMLTQAFGRNAIEDKRLPEIEMMRASVQDDEAAMAYLDSISFDPGDSNFALADTIAQQLDTPHKVTEQIAQWEVVYALYRKYPEVYARYRRSIHSLWPKGDFYPTYAVKADSIKVMDSIGAVNPIEFAHPDMMVRAQAILGRQGVWADILAADVPFDSRSVQAQVRGPLQWMVRETATRAEHVLFNRVKF